MPSVEEIRIRMGLDAESLKRGTEEMLAHQKSAADRFVNIWRKVWEPLAALFTIGGIFAFTRTVMELGKEIELTSERLGVTTDEVQKLQYAGALTGVELETISRALDRLAKSKEAILNNDPGSSKAA